MRCRKTIGYTLLLLANILLMVHVFVPHHQHNNRSYCSLILIDCAADDVYHNDHTHSEAEICSLDLIMEEENRDAFISTFENNVLFYIYLAALLNHQFKSSSLDVIRSLPRCSLHCISIILPSFSLRGPPSVDITSV